MATVDQGLAAWLKSEGLYVTAEDAALVAQWGERAAASEYMSPLALRSAALDEASRQLDFLSGPLAKDEHTIAGLWSSLVGQVIGLQGDRYGYEATPTVFVLRAAESETSDTTALTVLYRMPDTVRTRALTLPYFDFSGGAMPSGATLKRASIGSRINAEGLIAFEPIDAPRFDYFNGVLAGLLIEKSAINYCSTTSPTNLVRVTRTPGIADPAGGSDASRYVVASANSPSAFMPVPTSPSGRTFTESCFIRDAVAMGQASRALLFDYGTTGPESVSSITLNTSPAWTRFTKSRTFGAMTSTTITVSFNPFAGTGGTSNPTVGSAQDSAFWQYEDGAVATSYIPAGQTRAADALSFDWGAQGVPDGAFTFRVTFDNGSTQDVAMTVAGGVTTLPTNLTRPRVSRVQLLR